MKRFILMPLVLLAGCVSDTDLLRTDNSSVVQEMAQKRAVQDLKCKDTIADRPIRTNRIEEDWPYELYSEYTVWADGCDGRQVTYRVICRSENVCTFADQPQPPKD